MKTLSIFIVLFAICAITIGGTIQSQPKVWEYKFIFEANEKRANQLGQDGWELIAIQSTGPGLGNNVPTYVFKRAK